MTIRVLQLSNGSTYQYDDNDPTRVNETIEFLRDNNLTVQVNQSLEEYYAAGINTRPPEPSPQPYQRIYSTDDGMTFTLDLESTNQQSDYAQVYQEAAARETEQRRLRQERREKWNTMYSQLNQAQRHLWDNHTSWDDTLSLYPYSRTIANNRQPLITITKELAFDDPDKFIQLMNEAERIQKEINMARIRSDGSYITWNPVESSVIKSVAFDQRYTRWDTSAKGTLYVLFTTGKVYSYSNITEHLFTRLLGSESKGKYFNRYIKIDRHTATDLTPPLATIHNGIQEDLCL